jgi:hypothetical protein
VKKTRPYRPRRLGLRKFYSSEKARRAALPAFLHDCIGRQPHTAIGKLAPITRLTNLAGDHT